MALNNPRPSLFIASLAVLLPASLWGLLWWPLRYLDEEGIPGEWSVGFINLIAALVLLPIHLTRLKAYQAHLGKAALIGLVTGTALCCYYIGIIHTSIIRATLLFYMMPVWATLLGVYWLGEPPTLRRWMAIALGLVGLVLLLQGDHIRGFNLGDLFAFFSGVLWALGGALLNCHKAVPVTASTMFQHLFAALTIFPISLMVGFLAVPQMDHFLMQTPLMVLLSVVLFLPSILLIFWASQYLFPGRVGLLMMSEVLVAVISASLLLNDEKLQPTQWFGAALIIFASLIELVGKTDSRLLEISNAKPEQAGRIKRPLDG